MKLREIKQEIRIDKWLWAVRFCKTRSIATKLIDGGHIKLNSSNTKSSKKIFIGSIIEVKTKDFYKEVRVIKLIEKRVSYQESILCFEETKESVEKNNLILSNKKLKIDIITKKPTKKERRDLENFKKRRMYE
ncbi:MAG: S4 domain-containing protein [Psittacicella sp.]